MEFIQKHYAIIIGVLLMLFCFKSCQSCSRQRTLTFTETKYQTVVDSLTALTSTQADSISRMALTIEHQSSTIDELRATLTDLRKDKATLNEINKNNARSIKNLSQETTSQAK